MTTSRNSGTIVQIYQGRLFASRPPMVNIKNGPATAAVIPMRAAVRVKELLDTDLSFTTNLE